MAEEYGYNLETYGAKSCLKRYVHNKRFIDAINFINLKKEEKLLDYGCGDGRLLEIIFEKNKFEHLYGFEPATELYLQATKKLTGTTVKVYNGLDDIKTIKFDKIACLEVCEHLYDFQLNDLLNNISKIINPNGEIFISVPIETGFMAFLKNSFRFIKNKHYNNLSFENYFKAIFGLKILRGKQEKLCGIDYIYSHIGFNHKAFEKILSEKLKIEDAMYSPFNIGKSIINSSVYYKCKLK